MSEDKSIQEPQIEKKICPNPTQNQNPLTQHQLRIPLKFDISVIDPETPKKYFKMKTLQNLLLWLFCKNQTNPLWLLTTNKQYIRQGVILNMSFGFNQTESKFISQFCQQDKIINFKQQEQNKSNFWQSVFYTRYHEDPVFKPQEIKNNQQATNQEQHLYNQYNNFTLTREQLKLNLYPIDEKIYHDYIKLEGDVKPNRLNIFAIDCEMVQTKNKLELARVSIVDYNFNIVLDILVKPNNQILDYNTKYSGITEEMLSNVTVDLKQAQKMVSDVLDKDSILIGHSLENDLNALQVNEFIINRLLIINVVLYMTESSRKIALKSLASKYLYLTIQKETHDPNEDAKIALSLAKLRIEILEHFPMPNLVQPITATPDVFLQLKKYGGIHLIEKKSLIESFIKFEAGFEDVDQLNDEKKMIRLGEIMRQRNAGAQHPKLVFAEISEEFQQFENLFENAYNQAPTQTLFLLSFGGEQHQFILIAKN